MDMDLHLARVQQRWRLADDLAPGETLSLETLAHDIQQLPDHFDAPPDDLAETLLAFFEGSTPAGGAIEPDVDDDGVLIGDTWADASEPMRHVSS